MYSALLRIHSIVRWLVIIAGLLAAVRAWRASASPGPVEAPAAGLFFAVLFDVQLLMGLILYLALSAITTVALHSVAVAMRSDVTRFWLVEHPFGMVVGLIFAHLGRAASRGGVEDRARRRRAAIYFTLAIVIVLITVPWPFMDYGRPLI